MAKKPEPKFVVKYLKNTRSIEEQKVMYERFLKYLVKVIKEQEEIDKQKHKKKNFPNKYR